MGLRERLGRLTGALPHAPEEPGSLAVRLARLRPAAACGDARAARGPDEQALVEAIAAERLAPGVLRCEHVLAAGLCHGAAALDRVRDALPELHEGPVGDPGSWVFLDTETSGLAGGTGTWVFQLGVLRPLGDGWRLRQYLLARLDAEPDLLAAVAAELGGSDLLVTYNGKTFDRPLLATRFRLSGLADPLAGADHLDLLAPVRRAFSSVWSDCRLASAEERLLGFRRQGDLPGAAAPQAWLDWLRHGRIEPLAAVLRHNYWDLLSLAALVVPLAASFRDPLSAGASVHSVAGYHLRRGAPEQAYAVLSAQTQGLGVPGLRLLAELHRRRGEWEQACQIWRRLAEGDEPAALEALAKYYEHRCADPTTALAFAERLPRGPDRERRCARLRARLTAQAD